jgi:hypothetical protein
MNLKSLSDNLKRISKNWSNLMTLASKYFICIWTEPKIKMPQNEVI